MSTAAATLSSVSRRAKAEALAYLEAKADEHHLGGVEAAGQVAGPDVSAMISSMVMPSSHLWRSAV